MSDFDDIVRELQANPPEPPTYPTGYRSEAGRVSFFFTAGGPCYAKWVSPDISIYFSTENDRITGLEVSDRLLMVRDGACPACGGTGADPRALLEHARLCLEELHECRARMADAKVRRDLDERIESYAKRVAELDEAVSAAREAFGDA